MRREADHFGDERRRMVADQIERRGVRDVRVLNAMRSIPRHLFVPESSCNEAYEDGPLPIGYGQTISQPYIVAYMTECLRVRESDRVLEVGTGSGYQTAVLAALAKEVYTLEIIEPLGRHAAQLLTELGYRNIFFHLGDGRRGWREAAPFDRVIVTAAAAEVPDAFIQQLKDGGRLVMPVGGQVQELIEGVKQHEIFKETRTIPVRFVPLVSGKEEE